MSMDPVDPSTFSLGEPPSRSFATVLCIRNEKDRKKPSMGGECDINGLYLHSAKAQGLVCSSSSQSVVGLFEAIA